MLKAVIIYLLIGSVFYTLLWLDPDSRSHEHHLYSKSVDAFGKKWGVVVIILTDLVGWVYTMVTWPVFIVYFVRAIFEEIRNK